MNAWLLIPLLAALVQASALALFSVRGAQVDLVLVLVVLWGLIRTGRAGMIWAVGGGLALDLLSLAPVGSYTIPLLVVAFLVGLVAETPFGLTRLLVAAVTALAVLLYYVGQTLMLQLIGWPVALGRLTGLIPVGMALDVLLALLLLPVVRRLSWLAGDRDFEWNRR